MKYNPDTSNLNRDNNKKVKQNFDKVARSLNNIDDSQVSPSAGIKASKIDFSQKKFDTDNIGLKAFGGNGEYNLSVKNNGDLKKNNRFLLRYYENNLIVPLYINTGSLSQSNYQAIIDTRRKYSQVGITVIINPTDGLPLSEDTNGTHPNAAYTQMIEDLQGIGCRVIGYITTLYMGTLFNYYPDITTNPAYNVSDPIGFTKQKLQEWYSAYPQIDGIFYDEYWNSFDSGTGLFQTDMDAEIAAYKQLYLAAYDLGAGIVIGNPGTDTPVQYWDNNLADVFIISETSSITSEAQLSGNGIANAGHEFIDKRRKGAIAHSQTAFDYEGASRSVKYASWYYSTSETGGGSGLLWRQVSNHIEQQANFFAQSMKDHQVIGIQGNNFQVSPEAPQPKLSMIGYYDKAGDEIYTLNTALGNNWYFDGLHVNFFRNTSSNFDRFADIIAMGNWGGGAGGAHIRFFTNPGTSSTTSLRLSISKNGLVRVENALAATPDEITATSAGVAASVNTTTTEITTNGDSDLDNVTLANGVSGQIKHFAVVAVGNAADSVKITPNAMVGGTQITFAASPLGLGCIMQYADNEGWVVIGNNGGVIT